MSKKSFLKLFVLICAIGTHCFAEHGKIGIVFLHGMNGSAKNCKEWINFATEKGVSPSLSQCAVYIPEAENHSWFDVNPLLPDLIHISDPVNQTPENIGALLSKIKDMAPQFKSLKNEIKKFMQREGIKIENLHFVGYSQGGILAQMLAYSLPAPCGSLCFAGCPWVWMPGENIQKPKSIVMAINNDDPYFGNIFHYSRDMFKKKVGKPWFNKTVKEVIEKEGGHDISDKAKIEGTNHFKKILALSS